MCPIPEAAFKYEKCIEYLKSEGIELTEKQKQRIKEIIRLQFGEIYNKLESK